jgi:hypothetical protein
MNRSRRLTHDVHHDRPLMPGAPYPCQVTVAGNLVTYWCTVATLTAAQLQPLLCLCRTFAYRTRSSGVGVALLTVSYIRSAYTGAGLRRASLAISAGTSGSRQACSCCCRHACDAKVRHTPCNSTHAINVTTAQHPSIVPHNSLRLAAACNICCNYRC